MGKIKDKPIDPKGEAQDYTLLDEEFNYIMNINVARNNIVQEYNRVMSAFLHYVACSRLNYESGQNLQFELDFDDDKHSMKVWVLNENMFKPQEQVQQEPQA